LRGAVLITVLLRDPRGFDAGRRSRQEANISEALGLLPADIRDYDDGILQLASLSGRYPFLKGAFCTQRQMIIALIRPKFVCQNNLGRTIAHLLRVANASRLLKHKAIYSPIGAYVETILRCDQGLEMMKPDHSRT
jgi:hypothetical protein